MQLDQTTAVLTMECFSFAVGILVLVSCLAEQRRDIRARSFTMMVLAVSTGLLLDILAIFLRAHDTWYLLLNTALYLMGYASLVIYCRYQIRLFAMEDERERAFFLYTVECSAIVAAVLTLANIRYGWLFSVKNHTFMRGTYYPILQLYILLILTLSVFRLAIKKSGDRRERMSLLAYTLLPLTAWIVQYIFHIRLVFAASMVSIWVVYVNIYLRQSRRVAEQEKELAYARVNVMVSQIQPHFMFNTLTNIRALCRRDPERAQWAIDRFSACLRGNMASLDAKTAVPFERELNHISSYLDIEQLRFPDTLHVVYDLRTTDFRIPALSVQTLVENAVRHGITAKSGGGTVWIRTFEDKKYYYVEIDDDGIGFDVKVKLPGIHVGLENTRQRLQILCGGRLEVYSQVGEGTRVKMIIPKGGAADAGDLCR